jgi:hypothetical protein
MQWAILLAKVIGAIGTRAIVFSIYPSNVGWLRVLRFNNVPDRTAMEIVLTISRPIMFRVGMVLLAVGAIAGLWN